MADQKTTTIFEFKIEGVKDVVKEFENLKNSLPTRELQDLAELGGKSIGGLLESLQKGLNIDDLGIDDLLSKLSTMSESIQNVFAQSGITVDIGPMTEEMRILEERITSAKDRLAEFQKIFEEIKEEMLGKMASGEFGEVIDENFYDGKKAANEYNKVLKELDEVTKEGSKATKEEIAEVEKKTEVWKNFTEELKKHLKERQRLGSQMGGTQKGIGANEIRLAEARSKKAETEKLDLNELKSETAAVKKLAKEYNFLVDVIKELNRLKAAEVHKQTTKAIEQQAKVTKEAKEETEALEKATSKSEPSMAKKIVTGLSYYTIFNQIKKILKDSIKAIKELDKAMTKASIVTEMTRQESWQLLKTYQSLARETGRTTSEVANLNAFFLQQGKSIKQALEMTEAAAKSAAVAGTSLQDAANYITSAIHGFNLAASEAENVADKFAALGASSASSFEEIAIAMSKVAPVAQSAGVGIDFMMGILAKGIHTTREAPEAIGTAMKTIFARMRELTDIGKATEDGMSLNRVEKALNSVNVDLRDVTGQFRNLEDVLIDVGMKWDTLNSMEQAYLATALAGTRQQPRLLAVLNDFDTTMEMIETSRNAEDALMYQHMDYLGSMEAASNNLKNSWEQIVTSIVDSDVIIGAMQTLSALLEKVANVVSFITDRTWLLVPVLAAIVALTYKQIAASSLKIKTRLASIFGIKLEEKAEKKSALAKARSVYNEALLERVKKRSLRGRVAYIAGVQAETVAEQASATMAGIGAVADAGLTAAKLILKKAIEGVTKALVTMQTVAVPLLIIMLAFVAIAAIIFGIVKAFQHATKSVEAFGKEIDKSNKKIHESRKKVKAIKDLQEEYDELAKKVGKTNEELERMEEIMREIEGMEEDRFVDAFGEIDYQAIREYEKKEELKQAKEEAKAYKSARKAVRKFGKDALDNSSVKNQLTKAGIQMVDSMTKDMDDQMAYKIKGASEKALKAIDMKDFVQSFTQIDPYTGEIQGGGGDFFDFEAYKEEVKRVTSALTETFQELDKVANNKTLDSAGALQKQIEHIEDALEHDGFTSSLAAGLREAYPETVKLTEIMKSLNMETGKFSKVISALVSKGGSIETLVRYAEETGMGASYLLDNEYDSYEDYFDKTQEIRGQIEEAERKRDEYEKQYMEHAEAGNKVRAKRRKKSMQAEEDYIKKLEESLPEADLKKVKFAFEMEKYQEQALKFAAGDLKKADLDDLIEGVANAYQEVDEELSREDAVKKAIDLYIPMVQSPEETANAIKANQALIADSLKIADEVKKGDFTNYLKLVEEVGYDVAESFLESGDISKIQEKMLENQKNRIQDSIDLLEIQKEEVGLSESEQATLDAYKYMATNMENMVDRWAVWNNELAKTKNLLDDMNKNLDFLEKLEDLEIDIDLKDSLIESIEYLNDMAVAEMEKDIEGSYAQRQKDWTELEAADLVKDGQILAAKNKEEQRLIDAFFESNEYYVESAKNGIDLIEKQIDRYKKAKEKEIKAIEDAHKEQMDLLKKQHDEKWKAIDYENKILDLQEKVTAARNKLAAAMFGDSKSGQIDARKALKEAREARQKEIEKQILEDIQKKEEARKEERVQAIQKDISGYTESMAKSLETLLNNEGGDGLRVNITNPDDIKTETTTEGISSATGLGVGVIGLGALLGALGRG